MVYSNLLYSYLVLLAASILGYKGAEPALGVILLLATMLTLAVVVRSRGEQTLTVTAAVSAVNALLFAGAAYGIGMGIAYLAGT